MTWYAVFVQTGSEEKVKEWCNFFFMPSEVEVLVPKRLLIERKDGQLYKREHILFPGYVLINTGDIEQISSRFSQIPQVYKILKNEQEFLKIPHEEISYLLKILNSTDTIGLSTVHVRDDQKLEVIEGPLKYLEGNILKVNRRKKRVRVNLNWLGKSKGIDLGVVFENTVKEVMK